MDGRPFLFQTSIASPPRSEFLASGLVNRARPDRRDHARSRRFGQARSALGSGVSGTIGIRYSRDDKTMDNIGGSEIGDERLSSFQYVDSTARRPGRRSSVSISGSRDEAIVYPSATRGFKSGGFNITCDQCRRGFAPEWAWTYEAGVKSSALSERLNLNGRGVLHRLHRPASAKTPVRPGVVDITNAATATIRGVEVEGQAQPAPEWSVGGHRRLARCPVRSIHGGGPGRCPGRRGRTQAVQRSRMVRAHVAGVCQAIRSRRGCCCFRRCHAAKHRLLHADE